MDLEWNKDGKELVNGFIREQGWGIVRSRIYRGIGMGNSWFMGL